MALPTGLNRSRSSIVFLVPELVSGTINATPSTTDRFGLTTPPVIGQAGNYTDTSEIGPELISVDRVLNYMDYSTFDFEYYAKPQGVTETAVDLTGLSASVSTNTVTVSLTNDPSLAAGDTILVVSDEAAATGYFTVTNPTGTYDFDFVCATAPSDPTITSIKKVVLSVPEEHQLLYRGLGGVKYMSSSHNGYVAGASSGTGVTDANATVVQYFLANSTKTLTVTSRQFTGDSVQMFTATGSLPTSWSVSLAKDGPVTYTTGFQANRVYYAGTAEITNSSANNSIADGSGTVTYTVIAPKRNASDASANAEDIAWFQTGAIGAYVEVGIYVASTGTTTKYGPLEVTAVSGATVTLTNRSGGSLSIPADGTQTGDTSFLIPYTPEPCPDTTSILDQRKVQVFMTDQLTGTGLDYVTSANTELFNSANEIDVTAVSFDFDRSITTPGLTEMTGEEFPPASYVINEPTVSGSVTLLLRPKDFQLMNSLRAVPHRALGVRIGDTVGRIIEMGAPSVFMEVPTPGDADGATQIDIPFTVVRGAECEDADKFFIRYR